MDAKNRSEVERKYENTPEKPEEKQRRFPRK